MPFSARWHTLLDACTALLTGATLSTPLTDKRFRSTDIQDHRIVITFTDSEKGKPLQGEQFAPLAERMTDRSGPFDLQRRPSDAEPYAAVLSLHPRYELDTVEAAGSSHERITGVDRDTVDEALEVTNVNDSDVYLRVHPHGRGR